MSSLVGAGRGLEWVPKTGVTLNHDKFNSYHKRFDDNYNSHCCLRPLRKYTRGAY